jgi:hypothetical protein
LYRSCQCSAWLHQQCPSTSSKKCQSRHPGLSPSDVTAPSPFVTALEAEKRNRNCWLGAAQGRTPRTRSTSCTKTVRAARCWRCHGVVRLALAELTDCSETHWLQRHCACCCCCCNTGLRAYWNCSETHWLQWHCACCCCCYNTGLRACWNTQGEVPLYDVPIVRLTETVGSVTVHRTDRTVLLHTEQNVLNVV